MKLLHRLRRRLLLFFCTLGMVLPLVTEANPFVSLLFALVGLSLLYLFLND